MTGSVLVKMWRYYTQWDMAESISLMCVALRTWC